MTDPTRYRSFSEFYPFYLGQHRHPVCRGLHYAGTLLALGIALYALFSAQYLWLLAALFGGYALAWVGHAFFERNRPATFSYPLWSFMADWVMLAQFLSGRLRPVAAPVRNPGQD